MSSEATATATVALGVLRALLDERDHARFLSSLTPTATWTIPGQWDGISGVKDLAGIADFLNGIRATFPGGFATGEHRITASASTAVIEFKGGGITAAGRSYENDYCLSFEVAGDKVTAIREYMDTLIADAFIFNPAVSIPTT